MLRADNGPCPVCGAKGGNCAGEGIPPTHLVGLGGKIKQEDEVLVEEDVTEERWITPYTKTTVVLARAGTFVSREKADELGLT